MKSKLVSLVVVCAILLSACTLSFTRGSGNIVTEEREVSGFTRISVSGGGELILEQGESESLKVEADDNLMQYVETFVRNGELILRTQPMVNVLPSRAITYYVTLPEVENISVSGGGKLRADTLKVRSLDVSISGGGQAEIGELSGDRLYFDTSGGSKVYASELDVTELEMQISGGGRFTADVLNGDTLFANLSGGGEVFILGGEMDEQRIQMSGGGKYSSPDLKSQDVEIDGSGGSRLTVWAEENLDVSLSGGGSVQYYGNPAITSNMSGGARLESLGDR